MFGSNSVGRLAVHIMAGLGVSKVVNDIIRHNTSVVTTADAVRVWAGSVVIGSMITQSAVNHVDQQMVRIAAWNEKRQAETASSEN